MTQPNHAPKKLYLSSTDRRITGLCGGIGEYFDIDPSLVRLGWIVVTVLTGIAPGVVGYIVASLAVPSRSTDESGA